MMNKKQERDRGDNVPLIEANDLSKWYGEVIGLNSFNVEISSGITGIVGPNGAGKSTFFKIAIGLIKPNSGALKVMGEDPWLNQELAARVGFCPDYDNLSDDSTGERFLKLIGGLHGMSGNSLMRRMEEVTEIVGLGNEIYREIGGYSMGMRQKIKLAGSILPNSDLLLLDEPLTGADPKIRRSLIEVIKSLNEEQGHDVIVSSHVLPEIEKMTSRVVLIYKGRRIASGEISEIRELIDKYPHQIIIEGREMSELAKELLDIESTISVGFEDDRNRVKVEVSNLNDFFGALPRVVVNKNLQIESMYSVDEGLEAVFEYLVEE